VKKRITAAAAALLTAFSAMAGCSKENESVPEENTFDSENAFNEIYKDVPDSEEGPLLKIKDTTAPAGGVAEVTVTVSNADLKWNICGLHIIYPEELDCINQREGEPDAKFKAGPAAEGASLQAAMEWFGVKTEEMAQRKVGSAFYTAAFTENYGGDGDIVTFYLQIPEDAESGDTYDVDFYFYETDLFKGTSNDMSFQKYAFSHWEGGTITVE
jgi:hypothetical protein